MAHPFSEVAAGLKKAKGCTNFKGAFDITIGPLVNLWGFGPNGRRKVPSIGSLERVKENVGHHHVEIKAAERKLRRKNGVYLDLSAVAKGLQLMK